VPPFSWSLEEVLQIEPALVWRRKTLEQMAAEVNPSLRVATLSAFPLLGTPNCTSPIMEPAPDGLISQSILCPDGATSPHPRYQIFTANYRKRRGCKVGAFIPREGITAEQQLSFERIAQLPFELAQRGQWERDPVPGHIYLDSQAFGACQCCTQATFLARNLEDARHLTDQFVVLAPLLLALTAATPFLRGLVADTDTRWQAFQQTWDDRTEVELATICNSRCSPCDLFIGAGLDADEARTRTLNDVEVPVHTPAMQLLEEAGVDAVLARHVAHLLVRDPMMVFNDRLDVDDEQEADHWEQLQGTNWGSVRFKPPPCASNSADCSLGWRVEFRTPEVQITDFENAAIVSVIRLLAEVIIDEKWDLTIPISCCNANDKVSSVRGAATSGRFWFREAPSAAGSPQQRSLKDILTGSNGIFARCHAWLDQRCGSGCCSAEAAAKFHSYMSLFERRASGELPTPASFLRARLQSHPGYAGDGVLPADFVFDVCAFAASVNEPGAAWPLDLLGDKSH